MATASPKAQPILDSSLSTDAPTIDEGAPLRRRLVSDSIATGVVFALLLTVGQRLIGFVRGILFCKFMTDQELGQWSIAWSFLMLLAPLAALGLPGCLGRFSEHYRKRGQFRAFIIRVAGFSSVTTLCLAATIILLPEHFSRWVFRSPEHQGLIIALGGALVVVSLSNFLTSLMESIRQVRVVTMMRLVVGVVFAIVGTLLIATWQDRSAGATCGYAIASLAGVIPAIYVLWSFRGDLSSQSETLTHREMWKRIAPFAVWLWATNLSHNMLEVSDRYMLIHWSSFSAEVAQGFVGQYHSGRVVPLLLVSVATVLGGVLLPYLSAHWEAGKPEKAVSQLNWSIKMVAVGFTLAGVGIMLVSPILFDWILNGRYDDGRGVLPLTLVYCIWFSMFVVGQDYLWVAEKGKYAALATFLGLVTNLVLNMVLIPIWELEGAVVATTIGNLTAVSLVFGFNHLLGCPLGGSNLVCLSIPLIILLPLPATLFAVAVIAVLAWRSSIVFTAEEKTILVSMCDRARERFL